MDAAPVKRILLAAVAVALFLEIYGVYGAPITTCFFSIYSPMKDVRNAFRNGRNQYEDLRKASQPWKNCSGEHLQWPKGSLHKLTTWEKREAFATTLDLVIPVLQNHTESVSAKIVDSVLDYLRPFREALVNCTKNKPVNHEASGHLPKFQEELQTFNTRNAQQSPQCLELAVGMNLVHLLNQEIRLITQLPPSA